jgi:hypothetical protein
MIICDAGNQKSRNLSRLSEIFSLTFGDFLSTLRQQPLARLSKTVRRFMRKFNITGSIVPELHYYVDLTPQLDKLMALVGEGTYFVINRPRQFGKTTMLKFLTQYLVSVRKIKNYIRLDFVSFFCYIILHEKYKLKPLKALL